MCGWEWRSFLASLVTLTGGDSCAPPDLNDATSVSAAHWLHLPGPGGGGGWEAAAGGRGLRGSGGSLTERHVERVSSDGGAVKTLQCFVKNVSGREVCFCEQSEHLCCAAESEAFRRPTGTGAEPSQ